MKAQRDQPKMLALALGAVGLVAGILGVVTGIRAMSAVAGLAAIGVAGVVLRRKPSTAAAAALIAPPLAAPTMTGGASSLPPPPLPMNVMASDEPISNELTGLFNERYFYATVDTRVLAAKRHLRPVSVALVYVSDGPDRSRRADLVRVSAAVRKTLRDSDIACHLDDGRFAFILEDTPEDGAVWTLERLRRAIAEIDTNFVQWAGIACYPAHAFNTAELLAKAEEALRAAWEWPQARIEVANAS